MKLIVTRTVRLGGRDFTDKIEKELTTLFEKEYKPIDTMTDNMQSRTRYDIHVKAAGVKHDLAVGELDETTADLKKLDCDEDEDDEMSVEFTREMMEKVIAEDLEAVQAFVDSFFALVRRIMIILILMMMMIIVILMMMMIILILMMMMYRRK